MARMKWTHIILWLIIAAVLILVVWQIMAGWALSELLGKEYLPDQRIPSPDGKYELIVCEWQYLNATGSEVYIQSTDHNKWYNSWIKTKIGGTISERGVFTFADGHYQIDWHDDGLTVYYYRGAFVEDPDDPSTWLRSFSAQYP